MTSCGWRRKNKRCLKGCARAGLNLGFALGMMFAASAVSAERIATIRKGAIVRQGAGNYYPLIVLLSEDASAVIVDSTAGWYQISLSPWGEGWISKNCLSSTQKPDSATSFPKSEGAGAVLGVSPAALTAMVKGFSRQQGVPVETQKPDSATSFPKSEGAGAVLGVSPAALTAMVKGFSRQQGVPVEALPDLAFKLAPESTVVFRQELASGFTPRPGTAEERGRELIPYYLVLSPLLAAERVEREGGRDLKLEPYVNQVLLWLVEQLDAGDMFTGALVSRSGYYAVGFPGGWIAIGRELIDDLQDESELAAVLAHEWGHIYYEHGKAALSANALRIGADLSFTELAEMFKDSGELTLELDEFASEARALCDRKLGLPDEFEADAAAVDWLARGGYDPCGLQRVIERMRDRWERDGERFFEGDPHWIIDREECGIRLKRLQKPLQEALKTQTPKFRMKERFQREITGQ